MFLSGRKIKRIKNRHKTKRLRARLARKEHGRVARMLKND